MVVSVAEAVQALSLALHGLLPPPADPALAPDILVNPVKTHPAGIGGYVGLHLSPFGEVHARRLKAQVVVRVKADTVSDLTAAESAVTNALVAANPISLRTQGILRLTRDTSFGSAGVGSEGGITVGAGRDLRFDVDFEYRRLPDAPAGVLDELPLDVLVHRTDGVPRQLFVADFDHDPLAAFAIADDPTATAGPSNWSYNPTLGRIEQSSGIRGGSNAFNPNKRGTCLVLLPSIAATPPADFVLHAELGADSGGIGIVFNFLDLDNYHFFLMNRPAPYRFLGRREGGTFSFLTVGGQDDTTGYAAGDHRLRLIQQQGELELAIDSRPVLGAREDVMPPAGRVGFLCRSCPTARFRSLRWIGL